METKNLVQLADEQYNRGSFGAARVNYLEAIEALEKRNAELTGALEGAREWLKGWASAEPYLSRIEAALQPTLSSEPKPESAEPKCKTCGGCKLFNLSGSPRALSHLTVPCPDCTEPSIGGEAKCVCNLKHLRSHPVCGREFTPDRAEDALPNFCDNTIRMYGNEPIPCGHDRACHATRGKP